MSSHYNNFSLHQLGNYILKLQYFRWWLNFEMCHACLLVDGFLQYSVLSIVQHDGWGFAFFFYVVALAGRMASDEYHLVMVLPSSCFMCLQVFFYFSSIKQLCLQNGRKRHTIGNKYDTGVYVCLIFLHISTTACNSNTSYSSYVLIVLRTPYWRQKNLAVFQWSLSKPLAIGPSKIRSS